MGAGSSPDVVIVGGGIVGLCVAHALRRRGAHGVTIVERGTCGEGSTSRATGGIRTQFGSPVNVRLSLLSLQHFREWTDRYGGDAGYRPVGYLFLAGTPEQVDHLRSGARVQRTCGARADLLGPQEIASRWPAIGLGGVIGASFGPDDGLADPGAATGSLVSACRRTGVTIVEQTPVTRIELQAGRAVGVRTASGRLGADLVVLAAGVWSAPLARTMGLSLPITPHHRQVYRAGEAPGLARPSPLVVDLGTGVYFHTDGEGLVFGGGDRESEPGWDDRFRPDEAPRVIELLTRRLPQMAEAPLTGGWAGLREMTPDDAALVGPAPGVEGLYVAAGFSGHGFMHAPAVGEVVACQLTASPPPVDISALDPARFERGAEPETFVF
jgi:sarcosine oxidase subunit beta